MYRFLIVYFTLLLLTGCKDNLERTYYPNGQLLMVGERVNGKKEGIWISFDEQGDTLNVTPYLNGKEHGRVKYFDKGVLQSIWSYENGVGHGEHLSFYPNGAIESRSYKENGMQSSEVTGYYPTGELFEVMNLNGSIVRYFRNGQIECEIDNPENGIVSFYDSTGVKRFDVTIVKGQLTDTLYQAR